MKLVSRLFLLVGSASILTACTTLFDRDNTPPPSPLTTFTPTAEAHTLWKTRAGTGSQQDELPGLTLSSSGNMLFVSSRDGTVSATERTTGRILWLTRTGYPISSGTGTNGDQVFAGTRSGKLIALRATDGKFLWDTGVSSEVLAAPAANNGIVVARSIDGSVSAFSTKNGHRLWHVNEKEPDLVLHGGSAPVISGSSVYAGFEDGSVARYSLKTGQQLWKTAVAEPKGIFPVQRMVDIDATPIVRGNKIYVASWQGQLAALNTSDGSKIWSRPVSSYAGISVDSSHVYVSDAASHVLAFDAASGNLLWKQDKLAARVITGPALMTDTLVVGDAQGWLHWIDRQNGHFRVRLKTGGKGIFTTPLAKDSQLYVYTNDGQLDAYTLD